jgi:magnesium transporter
LLGVGRAVDFACELTADWLDGSFEPRMRTMRQDVISLNEYEVHLSDKVQFLLDAMVGLIGIAQNDIFKILTIVSIVGIPPTLVAGIYGMNFKNMPEYGWTYGYPYGLAVIAISAIAPLAWFKWRGWF